MNHNYKRKLERRRQRRFIRKTFNLRADHDKNSKVSTGTCYRVLVAAIMFNLQMKGNRS